MRFRRRDQICLVKFLFTFPLSLSLRPFRGAPHPVSYVPPQPRARYFPFALSCAETSAAGTQFPQFLLISIPAALPATPLSPPLSLFLFRSLFCLFRNPYRDYKLKFNSQLSRETTSRFQQKSFSEREISAKVPRNLLILSLSPVPQMRPAEISRVY